MAPEEEGDLTPEEEGDLTPEEEGDLTPEEEGDLTPEEQPDEPGTDEPDDDDGLEGATTRAPAKMKASVETTLSEEVRLRWRRLFRRRR